MFRKLYVCICERYVALLHELFMLADVISERFAYCIGSRSSENDFTGTRECSAPLQKKVSTEGHMTKKKGYA